jgi:hypothetical protein
MEIGAGEGASVAWGAPITRHSGDQAQVIAGTIGFVRTLSAGTSTVSKVWELPEGVANPISSTPGLLYHLDAAVGVTTDGELVTRWADQSFNGNDFLATDNETAPTWIAKVPGFNGLPGVRFDGLALNPLKLTYKTTPRTVFIVNTTSGLPSHLSGIWGKVDSDIGLRRGDTEGNGWRNENSNDFPHGGGALRVNGIDESGADGSSNQPMGAPGIVEAHGDAGSWGSTSLGGYYHDGNRNWAGEIAEVAVFDRVPTEAERQAIVGYLGAKYRIRTPFPPPTPSSGAQEKRKPDNTDGETKP